MEKFGYEITNANLVGDNLSRASIFSVSSGNEQHSFFFGLGESPEEIAKAWVAKRKLETGDDFEQVWPNGFELRIYND